MAYSKQSCNGITVEQINNKVYVNGQEIKTGKMKAELRLIVFLFCCASCFIGFVAGSWAS